MDEKNEKNEKRNRKEIVSASDLSGWFVDPFREFNRQGRAVLDLFNEGFAVPRIDIEDKGNSIVVDADMPDIDRKDIDLKVSEDSVTIKAEKTTDRESRGDGYYARERSSSGYYRVVKLPDYVDADSAKASYRNGTLKVELKKSKQRGTHSVKVE